MSALSKPDLANPLSRTLSVVLAQYQWDQTPPTTKVHTAGRVLASPSRGPISNDQPRHRTDLKWMGGHLRDSASPRALRGDLNAQPRVTERPEIHRRGWLIAEAGVRYQRRVATEPRWTCLVRARFECAGNRRRPPSARASTAVRGGPGRSGEHRSRGRHLLSAESPRTRSGRAPARRSGHGHAWPRSAAPPAQSDTALPSRR